MTATLNPPPSLRPLLHQKIDLLTEEDLKAVHQQLVLLEMKREVEAIGEEFAEEWRSGRMTQEKVDEAVQEYRATHPYRTPGRP